MSDMPDINKVVLSVRIPAELMAKLKRYATEKRMTVSDTISEILHREYDGVPLTKDDFDWIQKEIAKNENKRNHR